MFLDRGPGDVQYRECDHETFLSAILASAGFALSEFSMEKLTMSGRYRSSEYSTG
jgi:hypothetical protein